MNLYNHDENKLTKVTDRSLSCNIADILKQKRVLVTRTTHQSEYYIMFSLNRINLTQEFPIASNSYSQLATADSCFQHPRLPPAPGLSASAGCLLHSQGRRRWGMPFSGMPFSAVRQTERGWGRRRGEGGVGGFGGEGWGRRLVGDAPECSRAGSEEPARAGNE